MVVDWRTLELNAEHRNLTLQLFKFPTFVLEKSHSKLPFAANTGRRQHISIAKLLITIPKISCFDPAFVNQRPDAVIRLTDTDAQLRGELPLTEIRVRFERFEHTVVSLGGTSPPER